MKIKQHIPNLITLCNLLAGCMAIVCLLNYQKPELAFVFILLGLLFDFLDGMVARFLGVSSDIGKELDSLADAVSFGVFPAFLIMTCFQVYTNHENFGFLALIIAASSIYRLAHFNLDILQTKFFVGLATPANTLLCIGIYFWFKEYSVYKSLIEFILLILFVFFSTYILNAKIPMFSLKTLKKPFYKNTALLILIIFALISIYFLKTLAIAPIILVYILLSIIFKNQIINEEIEPE